VSRQGFVELQQLIASDFTQTDIIRDFYGALNNNLEDKSGENAIYMGKLMPANMRRGSCIGTSLRELVHKFRHKTLILLKMLMLQKRVCLNSRHPDA